MCECTCGKASKAAAPKFNVGDFVRIVRSVYTQHPARMAGGVGVVRHVHRGGGCAVEVLDGTLETWFFTSDELEKIA